MSNKISLAKTKALILKRELFEEADYLYIILTKNWGKLIVRAHGVRKNKSKLKSLLEPFTYGNIILTNNPGRKILVNIEIIDPLLNIHSNLEQILIAQFFTEVINYLVPEEEIDLNLWLLVYNAFQFLNQTSLNLSSNDSLKIQKMFLIRILETLGYGRTSSPEKVFYELTGKSIFYFNSSSIF